MALLEVFVNIETTRCFTTTAGSGTKGCLEQDSFVSNQAVKEPKVGGGQSDQGAGLSLAAGVLTVPSRGTGKTTAEAAAGIGVADDEIMASFGRLMAMWLLYHEHVQSSELAKVFSDDFRSQCAFLLNFLS